jgi:hypothetical protein
MKEEILSFSLHNIGMAMVLALCSPFSFQPHHVLSEEDIRSWEVSKNVNHIPNEEPKVDNGRKTEHEAQPHVVRESIVTAKVKEHQDWNKIYTANCDVETWVFVGKHVIVENYDACKYLIYKSKA